MMQLLPLRMILLQMAGDAIITAWMANHGGGVDKSSIVAATATTPDIATDTAIGKRWGGGWAPSM